METTAYLIKRLRYWAFEQDSHIATDELLEAALRLEEMQELEVDFNESLRLACEANKDLQAENKRLKEGTAIEIQSVPQPIDREALVALFYRWGLQQYIPHHTEIAMLADYLIQMNWKGGEGDEVCGKS